MTPLGCFAVVAGRDEVAAFRAATGLPPGDGVPATFPMRWLAAPVIRAALLDLAPEPDVVPVHESQSFDYLAPLEIGAGYTLEIGARREAAPDRLVLAGIVAAGDVTYLRLETVLRLFSAAAVAA